MTFTLSVMGCYKQVGIGNSPTLMGGFVIGAPAPRSVIVRTNALPLLPCLSASVSFPWRLALSACAVLRAVRQQLLIEWWPQASRSGCYARARRRARPGGGGRCATSSPPYSSSASTSSSRRSTSERSDLRPLRPPCGAPLSSSVGGRPFGSRGPGPCRCSGRMASTGRPASSVASSRTIEPCSVLSDPGK